MRFRLKAADLEESRCDVQHPTKLVHEYSQMMLLGLACVDQPTDMLVIGLGGGSLSKELAQDYPQSNIDNVEIDPGVVDAAKKYFFYSDTANVHTIESDGRVYVHRTQKKYDIIFLDAFVGEEIPFHVKTIEFYRELQKALKPGGVVVTNLHPGPRLYSSERKTLTAAFPQTLAYMGKVLPNVIVLAFTKTGLTPEQIQEKATRLTSERHLVYPLGQLAGQIIKHDDVDASAPVLTDDYAPVEVLRQQK
jgi:spermidine synthase